MRYISSTSDLNFFRFSPLNINSLNLLREDPTIVDLNLTSKMRNNQITWTNGDGDTLTEDNIPDNFSFDKSNLILTNDEVRLR